MASKSGYLRFHRLTVSRIKYRPNKKQMTAPRHDPPILTSVATNTPRRHPYAPLYTYPHPRVRGVPSGIITTTHAAIVRVIHTKPWRGWDCTHVSNWMLDSGRSHRSSGAAKSASHTTMAMTEHMMNDTMCLAEMRNPRGKYLRNGAKSGLGEAPWGLLWFCSSSGKKGGA